VAVRACCPRAAAGGGTKGRGSRRVSCGVIRVALRGGAPPQPAQGRGREAPADPGGAPGAAPRPAAACSAQAALSEGTMMVRSDPDGSAQVRFITLPAWGTRRLATRPELATLAEERARQSTAFAFKGCSGSHWTERASIPRCHAGHCISTFGFASEAAFDRRKLRRCGDDDDDHGRALTAQRPQRL
jgi:hypothetical protein